MSNYLDIDAAAVWESLADEMAKDLLGHYKRSHASKKASASSQPKPNPVPMVARSNTSQNLNSKSVKDSEDET